MNFEIRNGHDYIDEVKDLFVFDEVIKNPFKFFQNFNYKLPLTYISILHFKSMVPNIALPIQ